jgi:steroid delta-isomerase-like uncharacterized protein
MPPEENKAAVRRYFEEVINGKNLDLVQELGTPEEVDHPAGAQGLEEVKQFFAMLFGAFPDLRVEVHDVIGEGDLVAARVSYSGTHRGELLGIPATGRHARTHGVDFFRLQDAKLAEHWGGADGTSLFQQLGVLPPFDRQA